MIEKRYDLLTSHWSCPFLDCDYLVASHTRLKVCEDHIPSGIIWRFLETIQKSQARQDRLCVWANLKAKRLSYPFDAHDGKENEDSWMTCLGNVSVYRQVFSQRTPRLNSFSVILMAAMFTPSATGVTCQALCLLECLWTLTKQAIGQNERLGWQLESNSSPFHT